ncbi:BMP family lipoprotein [Mesoaciditoga sp.]
MKKVVALFFVALLFTLGMYSTAFSASHMKVALVIAGELGDKSFYDSSYQGLMRAEKDLGIYAKVLPCKTDPANYMPQMIAASMNFNMVIVVGYELIDTLKQVAPQFPKVDYVYIDDVVKSGQVTSIVFKQNESSFMAGALAAMITERKGFPMVNGEKIIGFVGGEDYSVIRDFLIGYEQGAHYVDPEVKILTGYVGGWDDPATAKEIALDQFHHGADIIFQVAGGSGLGVIDAAKQAHFWAIGVDSPQGYLAPNNILTSVVKNVGNAVYDMIKDKLSGTYKRGTIYTYGIANNGVGLSYSRVMLKNVPADVIRKLIQIRTDIITGKIKVKSYFDEK